RRGPARAGRQRRRQDHPAAGAGGTARRRDRRGAPERRGRRRGGPCPPGGLPRPFARTEGGPRRGGEPRIPVRPARQARGRGHRAGAGHRRAGRLRGHPGAQPVGRPAPAPGAGAAVAVAGRTVAAGRTLRQPRPARDRTGQPDGPRPPRRGRRGPGHHPRRVRGAAGADPAAGAGTAGGSGMSDGAPTLASAARALVVRDLRLLWRRRGDALQPALFAILVVVLFALALGSERDLLARAAPGVLWVAVLLSGLLALDTLFRGDAEDGSLEQWRLAPVPLAWLVLVRARLHWPTTAVPLRGALPRGLWPVLLAALALGTPLLSLIGAVVSALTVGMRRAGVLLALLALPLYVPVLVFGAGSVAQAAQGHDASGGLLLLAAGLVLA